MVSEIVRPKHSMLRCHKLHPYRIYLVQELCQDDTDHRVKFGASFKSQRIRVDSIMCSNEARFHLRRYINGHNTAHWAQNNSHTAVDAYYHIN